MSEDVYGLCERKFPIRVVCGGCEYIRAVDYMDAISGYSRQLIDHWPFEANAKTIADVKSWLDVEIPQYYEEVSA